MDESISEEELEESLEAEIAILLGIHEGNVEVTIEDGVASYIITSDTAETAEDVQDTFVESDMLTAIEDSLPVQIDSFNFDEVTQANILITIDTTGAQNNLNAAAETLQETFTSQGFITHAESN